MLKKICFGFVVVVAVFAGVVALRPSEFRVMRSAAIDAPASEVFTQVNDFHNWDAWSPWAKLDPAMKATFEGPAAGTGAVYKWSGNDEVGEGSMTLTESRPNDRIDIALTFIRPFACTNTTEFTFVPEGDGTVVTWNMTGHLNFVCKAMHLFVDMDKMVGGDFEKGLTQMKSVTEAATKKQRAANLSPTTGWRP